MIINNVVNNHIHDDPRGAHSAQWLRHLNQYNPFLTSGSAAERSDPSGDDKYFSLIHIGDTDPNNFEYHLINYLIHQSQPDTTNKIKKHFKNNKQISLIIKTLTS